MTIYIESSWSQEHLLRVLVRLIMALDEDREYELYKYMNIDLYEAQYLDSNFIIVNKLTHNIEFNVTKLLGNSIKINYI